MSNMTTVRNIPSLSVPATQNTAPVFEFRCLYTQDIRKKKKVWQDGSLKYHTFNKRVMVWDEQKNYIGDAHWRENVDLQEGAEFNLDRGALVEVGESIGSSVTDLVPLLETVRQHPVNLENTALSTSTAKAPPSSRGSVATRSQWQPKPLSAILGNSQGPIGRARLQTKSPYELRQENRPVPDVPQQRPAKRPCLSVQQENRLSDTSAISKMAATSSRPIERTPRMSRISLSGDRSVEFSGKDFVVLSDDDSTFDLKRPNVRPLNKDKTARLQTAKPVQCVSKPEKPRQAGSSTVTELSSDYGKSDQLDLSKPTQSDRNPRKTLTTGPNKARVSQPMRAADTIPDFPGPRNAKIGSDKGSQTTRLRFQQTTSRRKLMYRDLLPSKVAVPEERSNLQPRSNYHASTKGDWRAKREKRNSDLSVIFSSSPLSGFSPPVPTPSRESVAAPVDETFSAEGQSAMAIYVGSSPEGTSSPMSPTPPRLQAAEDIWPDHASTSDRQQQAQNGSGGNVLHQTEVPNSALLEKEGMSQGTTKMPELNERQVQHITIPEAAGNSHNTNFAQPESDCLKHARVSPPPATAGLSSPNSSRLAILDQQLILEVSDSPQRKSPLMQRTPQPRLFRRVRSANDSPEPSRGHGNRSSALPDPPIQEALKPFQEVVPTTHTVFKSPIKLQKSKSLSEVIEKTSAKAAITSNVPEIEEEPEDDEKGAWTAHEAWDLFSWWPEGRVKPDFSDADQETGQSNTMPYASFTPGFISAIDAL